MNDWKQDRINWFLDPNPAWEGDRYRPIIQRWSEDILKGWWDTKWAKTHTTQWTKELFLVAEEVLNETEQQ